MQTNQINAKVAVKVGTRKLPEKTEVLQSD